jgi:hypothetical protein
VNATDRAFDDKAIGRTTERGRRQSMRLKTIPIILAAALLVQGCFVLSLHPLYTEKDVVFDERLVGTWIEAPDSGGAWVFEPTDEETAYLMKITKHGELQGSFGAHLVKLGESMFLDLTPLESAAVDEFYSSHAILAHSIWRVDLNTDSLGLAALNHDWLKEAIEVGKVKIKHEKLEHMMLLTAEPPDMQNLVLKYPSEAFEDFEVVYRVK